MADTTEQGQWRVLYSYGLATSSRCEARGDERSVTTQALGH